MHKDGLHTLGSVAPWFARIGFGLVLVGYGVNHYRFLGDFTQMASGAYASVPALGPIATILAYIVPALMIVGGALFAVKQLKAVSKFCILASLGGILGWAGLAVALGSAETGASMMPMIANAALLIVVYHVIRKMSCCSSCVPGSAGCGCGPNCNCGPGCGCGPSDGHMHK